MTGSDLTSDPLVGTTLNGRYRIDEWVASGGFGAVYRATELTTGCDVAIKVLHEVLASDEVLLERFRREGETLALLRDPHTVATYGFGKTPEGMLFLAMEWLRGEAVIDRCRRTGPMSWREVVTIARAVCSALAEAHQLGIIHRDLKPANIHLEPFAGHELGFVKVLDFGVAKLLRPERFDAELTTVGEVVGTLEYMAPEQIINAELDPRADIYSLGIVMYELLTGRRPFEWASGVPSLVAKILAHGPPGPSTLVAGVPPELDAIIARCLAARPHQRFADVAELVAALDRIEPEHGRGPWALATATTIAPLPPLLELEPLPEDAPTVICASADTFGASAAPGLALVTAEYTVTIPMQVPRTPSRAARGTSPLPMLEPIIVTSYAAMLHAPRQHLAPAPSVPVARPWPVAVIVMAVSLAFGIGLALAL